MAILDSDPRPVLRQELARVFKNQRVIRAFEKIFELIPPEFINQQDQIDALTEELAGVNAAPSIALSTETLVAADQGFAQLPPPLTQLDVPADQGPSFVEVREVTAATTNRLQDINQGTLL